MGAEADTLIQREGRANQSKQKRGDDHDRARKQRKRDESRHGGREGDKLSGG